VNRPSSQCEYMSLGDFEELLADKPADEKWELIGGRVVRMMVGAWWERRFIAQNLGAWVRRRLREKGVPRHVFIETFYMKRKSIESATLPDVMVKCGAMQPGATSADDPAALVEIMSEGGKARDRFEKWALYQQLPSLQHYVPIERNRPHIETFDRVGTDWSGVRILDGLQTTLELPAIGVGVPLVEIYRDVVSA